LNEDGIQDDGEPGVYYVKVTLNNGATSRTNINGFYMFHNIDAGDDLNYWLYEFHESFLMASLRG
jgi:hypothetical protein